MSNWLLNLLRLGARPSAFPAPKSQVILNVMIDLETLSTNPNAYIRTLGACFFDTYGVNPDSFYESCDGSTQRGADVDPATVAWWKGQSPEAHKALVNTKKQDLETVLHAFRVWLEQEAKLYSPNGDGSEVTIWIWGNGGDFDPVVLANAFRRHRLPVPWKYYGVRCYRTLKALNRHILADEIPGEKHNALDDAVFQAHHAVKILRRTFW